MGADGAALWASPAMGGGAANGSQGAAKRRKVIDSDSDADVPPALPADDDAAPPVAGALVSREAQ